MFSIILNHHGIVDVKMLIFVVKHLNQSELFDGGDVKIEERVWVRKMTEMLVKTRDPEGGETEIHWDAARLEFK